MQTVARVALVSNLPQLDKLFDYSVPSELAVQLKVGSRVKVPFGRGSRTFEGFVLALHTNSEFSGKLSNVLEVIGSQPTLSVALIQFFQELAERSASSIGEILRLAVPTHMPRAFKSHVAVSKAPALPDTEESFKDRDQTQALVSAGSRHAVLSRPGTAWLSIGSESRSFPNWVVTMCSVATLNVESGKSSILAVPDFRDQEVLLEALSFLNLDKFVANFSQEQAKSKIYESFLQALDQTPRVIVGSRSVIFAPAHNLGTIAIFDEADQSFTDQSAPYLNTRDSALLRQSIQGCSIVLMSHSRSTDVQRLVETVYLTESSTAFPKPKISGSDPGFRVDSHAFNAIRKGLESGSVLVQVASRGESTALFCTSCDKRLSCPACAGPVWVDSSGARRCRWCNALSPSLACTCGSLEVSKGRAGASRTAAELGRAFPSSKVIESTGDNKILRVTPGKNLVIATAGAEPFVESGYRAVVLLDAQTLLSRQNLRATEDAVRLWANAVSKMATDGEALLVGVSGALAQKFCLWQQIEIADDELASRRELMLPPALRLGSIAGTHELLVELAQGLTSYKNVQVLGPAPYSRGGSSGEWRLIIKYSYSDTVEVAKHLRGEAIRLSRGKSVLASSGRAVRALKVRMSDGDVV